ncbi:MAG: glycosyltransferase [Thiobacillus sp.]|nr:glycosyltransferase [Gammaproteobacteria bacterium]MDP1923251.1 glycosyltransferase [Thiobacillus sp.]MDP3126672.1 glycosyltransferase [Thiobacillus sp.]
MKTLRPIGFAPIVLFVYARPEHTRRTLEALAANALADQSDLIVYSDASRSEREAEAVRVVRELILATSGFRSVTLVERNMNFGLARNIIEGVSEVLRQHECVIVLEDDMVTSPFFLTYMNDALKRYANDDRIISIHGYVYPVAGGLPEAFFLPGADCWGWATWRRGWACFNPDGAQLLRELKQRKLERTFDYEGSYPYTKMLEAQIAGTNDSWAIRWYASAFLLGKLTLYPGRSLVHNIGNDATGTHCDQSSEMDTLLSNRPIRLDGVAVESSTLARGEFARFFNRQSRRGITGWIRRLLGSLTMERAA